VAPTVDAHLGRKDAAAHLAPETMQPGQTMLSSAWPTRGVRPAMSANTNLGGGRLRLIGADRPRLVIEVQFGVHRDEVHVGLVVGVERSHVAPVMTVPRILIMERVRPHHVRNSAATE